MDGYFDGVAIPRQCLIDRIINYFIDYVMKTDLTRGSDVHCGPLTNRITPFQYSDRRPIISLYFFVCYCCSYCCQNLFSSIDTHSSFRDYGRMVEAATTASDLV